MHNYILKAYNITHFTDLGDAIDRGGVYVIGEFSSERSIIHQDTCKEYRLLRQGAEGAQDMLGSKRDIAYFITSPNGTVQYLEVYKDGVPEWRTAAPDGVVDAGAPKEAIPVAVTEKILREIQEIEKYSSEAYQRGDDVDNALIAMRKIIGKPRVEKSFYVMEVTVLVEGQGLEEKRSEIQQGISNSIGSIVDGVYINGYRISNVLVKSIARD